MRTILILDEQSVSARDGVEFCVNPASKHPDNPVMLPGEPHQWDSLQVSWPATVLYSESDRKFRCWYSGFDIIQTPDRTWKAGYAESEDGIHWVKPELGQVTFLDLPSNQIKVDWDYTVLSLVCENPMPDAREERRFVSYWTELRGDTYVKGLAYSPDGVNWTRDGHAYSGLPGNRASFQDVSQIIYDADEPAPEFRVKGYSQILRNRSWDNRPMVRHIGLVHGRGIEELEDAEQPVVLSPEEGVDEELHFATVSKAGEDYVMLYESGNFSKNPIHGDIRLAVSPDGRSFRRVHPRVPFIATGPKGMWDENLLVTTTSATQLVGDEIYIFYIGCPNIYNSWPPPYMHSPQRRGSMFAPAYLGLATLPRDRYACAVSVPGKRGTVTLGPVDMPASASLWLNAEGDVVSVTAVEETGRDVAFGHLGSERSQAVYRRVGWTGAAPVGSVKLRIALSESARLYSVRVGE